MTQKKLIAILTGGTSAEREVALRSAANVEKMLSQKYDVRVFDIPSGLPSFLEARSTIDVVIPVLHGKGGEDGTVQGFLETLAVPYLFSGVQAQAIAMDKEKTKVLVAARGIQTPQAVYIKKDQSVSYDHPVVVKPVDGGSSVATAVAKSQQELDTALVAVFAHSETAIVEDFIEGQEYTVAVIEENGKAFALPVILIRPREGFFDYAAKYNQETLAEEICPAPIDDALSHQLQQIAMTAHLTLGCRHMSRTDIIVDKNGEAWFLEINTIPGMTATSLVPKAVAAAGKKMEEIFAGWIEGAVC